VAEATWRYQVILRLFRGRVTCVKHLCNWMEIATPLGFQNNRGGPNGRFRPASAQG
jgi:hypothetical protein